MITAGIRKDAEGFLLGTYTREERNMHVQIFAADHLRQHPTDSKKYIMRQARIWWRNKLLREVQGETKS